MVYFPHFHLTAVFFSLIHKFYPITVTTSINDVLNHNIQSVHSACGAEVEAICPQPAAVGPRFVLVSSSSNVDKMDNMIDSLLFDMMNFVKPSILVSSGEEAARPHPANLQDSSNKAALSAPPSSLPDLRPDGMDSLDRLFDSLIFSLFGPDEYVQLSGEMPQLGKPFKVAETPIVQPSSTKVVVKKEGDTVSTEANVSPSNGDIDAAKGAGGLNSNDENVTQKVPKEAFPYVKTPVKLVPAVDSERRGQTLSSVSDILLSRKDVQEDPIKARFARRLSEWDGQLSPIPPRDPDPSSRTQQFAEFPPLFLPFRNSERTEKCLWEHYKSHKLSSRCYSALDATRLTFQALKLQQLESTRNERLFSQLYLCLVLVFGMTVSFALLAMLSVHRRANSGKALLKRQIVRAVYNDPFIKSKVEDAIGKDLGVIHEKSQKDGCIGRFFILLPTLALALLLLVSAVISPVLVLLVGVPTLLCMGVYSCTRDCGHVSHSRRKRCADVAMAKRSGDATIATTSAVYVAIPVV
jgi:hypothetical protein